MQRLNLDDLETSDFELRTKARSLSFGRRLYYAGEHALWLKTQIPPRSDSLQSSQHAELGWQRELDFYQVHASSNDLDFFLPHQIIQHPFTINHENFEQALILVDAPAHFYVMPHLQSVTQIRQHLLQAVEPLICLQELGYLHADLKQEHFVNDQGRVCLLDFEHVQTLHQNDLYELNATPRYMAPELFQGHVKTVQSEVYALGIIFYEWLSGQRLQASNYLEWALLHCQRLKIELPEHLQAFRGLIVEMLGKQQQHRLADFKAVRDYLMTEIE
ncbi:MULTISPECIES: protein kinase [unclassified Acinetobacter]|uniref:protein kinase domain-containing protein n=1 Tax=unclassified Acinetobacter TaxID=196816 RepID=UPI001C24FAB6|nr:MULTISPECIES: protein kinase [unclassified Acinetobacter]